MAKEKEADARKRKPTAEPCPDDSHQGEAGGDVAKKPELPPSPLAPPSPHSPPSPFSPPSPLAPPSPFAQPSPLAPPSPVGPLSSPLVFRRPRSRLPPSPLGSTHSSSPVGSHSARRLLRFYDREKEPIPSSADRYPQKSLEDDGPELSLGFVEEPEQDLIDDEKAKIPYIGDMESLSTLADEYQSSTYIFQRKIELLREKHRGIRRVKGDGNCFYRSFIFAYLEYLWESQNEAEMVRVLATAESLREKFFELGKSPFIISNSCDVFIEMVNKIRQGKMNHMELLQSCRGDMSDNLVQFLRMVAACEMCRRKDHYEPFVAGMSNTTVEMYCLRSVERLGEETENMEIRALSDALGVPLRLENLDQSLTNGVPLLIGFEFGPHDDPEDIEKHAALFTLLYRPGHYDILYPI